MKRVRSGHLAGRRCAICDQPGGISMAAALRSLGYERQFYAHVRCVVKERRQQRHQAEAARPKTDI